MSEPKLISPMLDGFAIGGAISSHYGISCYPAMPYNSDKRYIVKVISIPASQVQLDALLLAGAYSSQESALAYFRELADGVAAEADILKKLSRFEGFIPFDDLQIVPKDAGNGYDVYLLSPYKRSLERHLRKKPMTHLNAVNLGLDLCASMVVCRRRGYLYVDLKPSNVFINEKNEFRVGDLGFVKLDSLQYASLPEKYRSAYTAPEITDAWSSLNDTLDTYAIGMILYQIYNDGKLPFDGQAGPEELPPPLYADYEMAEIILKAIAPKPELRWSNPMLMGQALVAYMQRNTVNDVPIVPLPEPMNTTPVPDFTPEPTEGAVTEESSDTSASASEDTAPETAGTASTEIENTDEEEILPALLPEEEPVPEDNSTPASDDPVPMPVDELTDLSFMDQMVSDDTTPSSETAGGVDYAELSDDTSVILNLADELIALEMPEPVVAPEPIEIQIPEPVVIEDEPSEERTQEDAPNSEPSEPVPEAEEETEEPPADPEEKSAVIDAPKPDSSDEESDDEEPIDEEPKAKGHGGIIVGILIAVLLIGALFGGYYYYNNYYLQTVDSLRLEGNANTLTVYVGSDVDESLLTVVCTDSYGNTRSASVQNGVAVFDDLNPDTIYQIKVVINGFHQLMGHIADDYTTPTQTNILRFDAIAGSDDGSVVLNFTVDGKDSDNWTVHYEAAGEQKQSVSFSGHLVTINGLTPGKEYTFTLSGNDSMYITGNTSVSFTPSALVFADGLAIASCDENGLTAVWREPEGVSVSSWTVRCYNDAGYDQTITTSDLTATFTEIDPALAYTVEVIADGMTVGTRTYISGQSTTITSFTPDTSIPLQLSVSWEYTGAAPAGGWLVLYKLEGTEQPTVIQTAENRVTVSNSMPDGVYEFTIQAADGTKVFNDTFTCTAGNVSIFSGYGVSVDNMTLYMVHRPDKENWSRSDIGWKDYSNTYAPGDKVSLLIQLNKRHETSSDIITAMFVVRDADGNLACISTSESSWTYMWSENYCGLDVPKMPQQPGSYTLDVYFNSMAVSRLQFTITE